MGLRAVGVAAQALLRTIAKVAGAEIVQDAVSFFQAFEGMEDGFRSRASAVHELLADPATAYVLVTSARPDAITEAGFFAEKLAEHRDVAVAALVVNRIAPVVRQRRRRCRPERARARSAGGQLGRAEQRGGEERAFSGLAAQVSPAPVGKIPLFGQDVHELEGLRRAADHLFD